MNQALLVGINSYKEDLVLNLLGCINDVNTMETFLKSGKTQEFNIRTLKDNYATRSAIIDGFEQHLSQAGPGEIALFYFAGHGSTEFSPDDFAKTQGSIQHESLICYDSRTLDDTGNYTYDLADKELKYLIQQLADKEIEIVIILDSCHSGSATRGRKRKRHCPASEKVRPKNSFYKESSASSLSPRHILLAACDNNQSSIELTSTPPGGIFTSCLLKELNNLDRPISYHELHVRCRNKVLLEEENQTPQLQAFYFNCFKPFLDPTGLPLTPTQFRVEYRSPSWIIDLGSIQGVSHEPGKIPQFEIFQEETPTEFIGRAEIKNVFLDYSTLKIQDGANLNKSKRYKASPTFWPLQKMRIAWSGNSNVFTHWEKLSQENYVHFFEWISLVGGDPQIRLCKYGLDISDSHFQLIYEDTKENILGKKIEINTEAADRKHKVPLALPLLKHIDSWERLIDLENRNNLQGVINHERKKLQFAFSYAENSTNGSFPLSEEITLDFAENTGDIDYEIVVTRPKHSPLYYQLLYFSRKYEIERIFNDRVHSGGEDDLLFMLEDALYMPSLEIEPDLNQFSDTFKLIVSSEQPRYFYPDQDSLPDTLDWFLSGQPPKRDSRRGGAKKNKHSWFTKTISVKCLRQIGKIGKEDFSLATGKLRIKGHPSFKALISLASSARHIRAPYIDMIIRNQVDRWELELLDFSTLRKKETIIEIHHIENHKSLKTNPLEFQLETSLKETETIVALTLNEETEIVSLGEVKLSHGNTTGFSLSHFPKNPHDGRGLPYNSLKVSFVKLTLEKFKELVSIGEILT